MSGQAHLFGAAGRTDDPEVLAEHEADYTPVAVAVQLLLALQGWGAAPRRHLDPSAGSCCWSRAVAAVFGPEVTRVGADIREAEAANLAAACHVHIISDATVLTSRVTGPCDFIASNPPFSAFESFWPSILRDQGVLAPRGIVAFYGLSQWGQSAQAAPLLRRWSPTLQLRCGGRIAHRGTREADAREYSLWVWREDRYDARSSLRPQWQCEQLPELPSALRQWSPSAVPGTYPIEPALVEEIRRRYL